jgi:hypothetical protein
MGPVVARPGFECLGGGMEGKGGGGRNLVESRVVQHHSAAWQPLSTAKIDGQADGRGKRQVQVACH